MTTSSDETARPIVLMLYLGEIDWAAGLARALRARGTPVEAWVCDDREIERALATGAFDEVVNVTEGFRRGHLSDDERDRVLERARAIEAEVGEPFLHHLAASDRTLTGYDHVEVPPYIPERWTWSDFAQLSAVMADHVRRRVDAVQPLAVVGELGGFSNRFITRYAGALGTRVIGMLPLSYHDDRVFFTDRLDAQWPEWEQWYERLGHEALPDDARVAAASVVDRIRNGRTLPVPRTSLSTFLPSRRQRFGPSRLTNVFAQLRSARDEARVNSPHGTYPELMTLPNRLRRKWQRSRILRLFEVVASREVPTQPFAVYFLHSQPEVTVEGWAFDYMDQVSVIRSLAARLPADMQLAVKEHACQAGLRDPNFYRELLTIPDVQLVHDSIAPRDLVARAAIVFTLTGTVAIEAMCLGTPCVLFGSIFYEHMTGVRRVHGFEELSEVLEDLDRFPRASEAEIERALAARHLASRRGGWFTVSGAVADPELTADVLIAELHLEPSGAAGHGG